MSGLPRGWEQASIRSIASRTFDGPFGSNLKNSDYTTAGVRVIRLENIGRRRFIADKCTFVSENKFHQLIRHELSANDILFSSFINENVRVCVFPSSAGISINKADVFCVRVDESQIDAIFLMYRLSADDIFYVLTTDAVHGATRPRIGLSDLQALEVEVPPTAEQRRIVAKIDSLSAKSSGARDHLSHIPQLVEKYKQAVLANAFGRGGETLSLGELVSNFVAGKNLRCEERPPLPDERGVIKVSAVSWGTFDPLAAKTLPFDFDPPKHTRISKGDFLISRANTIDLVGAPVIVGETPDNLYLSDKVLRLEMAEDSKLWTLWFLRSPAGRRALQEGSSGNQLSMRNISQDTFKAIELPWPQREERNAIVRRIETAFAWIDRLAAEAGSARALLDRLDQAILAKAFRGELVPQDPTDEPANVLLSRIRAERAAAGPRPKRSRRPRAASDA